MSILDFCVGMAVGISEESGREMKRLVRSFRKKTASNFQAGINWAVLMRAERHRTT